MNCCYNIPETPEHKIDGVSYTLTSDDGVYMIKVVGIIDLLDRLYPHGHLGVDGYGERHSVKKWCDENNSHYYAAPREDFSIGTAIHEAIANRKSCVVVEDLS
tara:strand:- start:4830 stop:5138 length:309 start_codon:yes stop_codon:yes gene_type:complete